MRQFSILILGCGGVAQCVIPLLLRHLKIPADRITVMDLRDNRDHVASALERGVKYVQERISPDHFQEQLGRHLGAGDILLDLAWNLETTDLLKWCHQKGVHFLNTSVEGPQRDEYLGSVMVPLWKNSRHGDSSRGSVQYFRSVNNLRHKW